MVRSFRWNGRKPYGTGSSRERHDHARRPSSNTAIASFALDAEQGPGDQPQDGGEVAQAPDFGGFKDGADDAALHGPDRSRRGSGRRIPAIDSAAARRLPLRVAALDPSPNTVGAASVPPAAPHLSPARHGGRQAEATALQALPDRLLSHRYRRGADRRRQAVFCSWA